MTLTVLLGGARSGKTAAALELAGRAGRPVTYVATAPRIEGDTDFDARIDRHRAERPPTWTTVEEPVDLAGVLRETHGMVIVDCLTLWVSNLLHEGRTDDDVQQLARDTSDVAARATHEVVAVSNEVGMGVHPATELGRRYRDVLGRVNQTWVAAAHRALLLVAGRALDLRDPHVLLGP